MLKDYYAKYKNFLPVIGIGVALLVIVIFILSGSINDSKAVIINEDEMIATFPDDQSEAEAPVETDSNYVFVEVKGAVKNPGVYELPADARVTNVLSLAEVLSTADLLTVNQSQKVKDEMVIYIPAEGEIEVDAVQSHMTAQDSVDDVLVDINTAGVTELTRLNGIGEKKAQLIIEYREANGLFMAKEDLMNISGIGEKTFDSLEPYITID